ncbi:MAG: redox-sensing transcriptional repressor Rex [Clostridium sp.]|nr:redox-sensing transcriptional repressor Rex [Clostridium sp.]
MIDPKNLSQKGILPEPTLRRLPWYLAYVKLLRERGVEFVSSTAIAKELNVDSSQIAKDLSFLELRGKTRIGYEVSQLEGALRDFLGFNEPHRAIIVGVGSLGAALIADSGLSHYGLDIVAGFDIDPAVVGSTIRGVPVHDLRELESRRARLEAEIGIITVPVDQAQEVADLLVASGIKALWNFTPFRIRTSAGIVVTNTSIYAHLAVMYNRLDLSRSGLTDIL